jgi:hypothetical protein
VRGHSRPSQRLPCWEFSGVGSRGDRKTPPHPSTAQSTASMTLGACPREFWVLLLLVTSLNSTEAVGAIPRLSSQGRREIKASASAACTSDKPLLLYVVEVSDGLAAVCFSRGSVLTAQPGLWEAWGLRGQSPLIHRPWARWNLRPLCRPR